MAQVQTHFEHIFSELAILIHALRPALTRQLRAHPNTAAFMKDPSFVKKIEMIQANPSLANALMGDKGIMQAMMVLLGMDKVRPVIYLW